jgi:hypothetical protein
VRPYESLLLEVMQHPPTDDVSYCNTLVDLFRAGDGVDYIAVAVEHVEVERFFVDSQY